MLRLSNIEAEIIIHSKIENLLYSEEPDARKRLAEESRQIISKDFIFKWRAEKFANKISKAIGFPIKKGLW